MSNRPFGGISDAPKSPRPAPHRRRLMRAAGVPVDVYSLQLGHSDIKTTQIYMGDLSPEQLAGSARQRDVRMA